MSCSEQSPLHGQASDGVWSFPNCSFKASAPEKKRKKTFLPSIVDGRGSSSDFAFYSLGRCPQISETCRSGCCQRVLLSWNSLEILRPPPKFLEILVLFVSHTREFLRREREHVSRPDGGGCESSRTLAPSLFLLRCFLFGRAISVFSERSFNR